eukprot:3115233-Rhodomonas_salina.4
MGSSEVKGRKRTWGPEVELGGGVVAALDAVEAHDALQRARQRQQRFPRRELSPLIIGYTHTSKVFKNQSGTGMWTNRGGW